MWVRPCSADSPGSDTNQHGLPRKHVVRRLFGKFGLLPSTWGAFFNLLRCSCLLPLSHGMAWMVSSHVAWHGFEDIATLFTIMDNDQSTLASQTAATKRTTCGFGSVGGRF